MRYRPCSHTKRATSVTYVVRSNDWRVVAPASPSRPNHCNRTEWRYRGVIDLINLKLSSIFTPPSPIIINYVLPDAFCFRSIRQSACVRAQQTRAFSDQLAVDFESLLGYAWITPHAFASRSTQLSCQQGTARICLWAPCCCGTVAVGRPQLSIDIPRPRGSKQQTRRCCGRVMWQTDIHLTVTQTLLYITMRVACTYWLSAGCGDDTEKWRNGDDGLGREHSILVDGVQRGHPRAGQRWWGLADASQQSVLPTRIHVHHLLRLPDILATTD